MPGPYVPLRHFRLACLAYAASLAIGLLAVAMPVWSSPARAAEQDSSSNKSSDSNDEGRYRVTGTDGSGLRMRKEPGLDAKIVAYLPEGALVRQRDGKAVSDDGEKWVPISTAEGQGWVASRYVEKVKLTTPAALALPPDTSFADRVVAIARSANGQPYVWAGNAPGGFDCSGFAQWVYTKAGLQMPRTIEDQLALGKRVDRDALKPGDLLSFVDTYQDGISHVGIYLGNNLFQHASDEVHGVTVSSLTEQYWQDRLYRAVRLR